MKFTGRNLDLVCRALEGYISDLRNEIATCPDVQKYADVLDDLDAEITQVRKLLGRVLRDLKVQK
jgi:hypothetical protein